VSVNLKITYASVTKTPVSSSGHPFFNITIIICFIFCRSPGCGVISPSCGVISPSCGVISPGCGVHSPGCGVLSPGCGVACCGCGVACCGVAC
jgi:hypothetical protein